MSEFETSPSLEATEHLVLVVTEGHDQGEAYPLGSEEVVIDDRFSISFKNGVYLMRSLTEREVMVSDVLAMESIVSKGDTLVTESSEYELRAAGEEEESGSKSIIYLFLIIAAAAMGVILLFPNYVPKIVDLEGIQGAPETMMPMGEDEWDRFESDDMDEGPREYSLAERNQILARARLNVLLADRQVKESTTRHGNVFWAIKRLEEAEIELNKLDPVPDLFDEVQEKKMAYQEKLSLMKEDLMNNAKIALEAGNTDSARHAFTKLLSITQDPRDPTYIEALEYLRLLGNQKKTSE